jgi:hypothetical protein
LRYMGEDPGGCYIVEFGTDGEGVMRCTLDRDPIISNDEVKQWLEENVTSPEGWSRFALRLGPSWDRKENPYMFVLSIKFYRKEHAMMFLLRFK